VTARPLAHAEAPGLHALAERVLLAPDAGFAMRGRVVTIGIALLALLAVPELTALLVRERALHADRRFWRSWTRTGAHRRALQADAAATDGAALARAIETVALAPRLFRTYLDANVAFAIDHGALPGDLADGFVVFTRRFAERGVTARLRRTIETAAPDARGLPSLDERLRALPASAAIPDAARAIDLLDFDHGAWLAHEIRARFATDAALVAWADIPARILAPAIVSRAAALSARLAPIVPEASFATVHAALAAGRVAEIAAALEPRLVNLPDAERSELVPETVANALVPLFSAALLTHGATITSVLGEESPCFRHRAAIVSPLLIVLGAMADGPAAPTLATWASALR